MRRAKQLNFEKYQSSRSLSLSSEKRQEFYEEPRQAYFDSFVDIYTALIFTKVYDRTRLTA